MKIAVDLGHGVDFDRGAVGYISEETIINAVGKLVIKKLKNKGHEVIEVRPNSACNTTDSLCQRTTKANKCNVDLYVSIHANAGKGVGSEVYTYKAKKNDKAVNVLNNIVKLGFKNRGIQDGSRLYVIRHTAMEAMLIEVCFTDTKSDVDLYNRLGADTIAEAIVNGLLGSKATSTSSSSQNNFVKQLQQTLNKKGANLVVDGIAGPLTLGACPLLACGSMGTIVSLLQSRLNSIGFSSGNVDGMFGQNTKKAVMNFQKSRKLSVDGIVGKNTWSKLLGLS